MSGLYAKASSLARRTLKGPRINTPILAEGTELPGGLDLPQAHLRMAKAKAG